MSWVLFILLTVEQSDPERITLLAQGARLTVYTRRNGNNFGYIGMPTGGIAAGQPYLGGNGRLWFRDIFNINRRRIAFLTALTTLRRPGRSPRACSPRPPMRGTPPPL